MLTRCPDCATHFRVTAEQLKVRSGRVRCGQCQHVFNALDSLIEEPALALARAERSVTAPPQAMPTWIGGEVASELPADDEAHPASPPALAEPEPEPAQSALHDFVDDPAAEAPLPPPEETAREPDAITECDTPDLPAPTDAAAPVGADAEASSSAEHLDDGRAPSDAEAAEVAEATVEADDDAGWEDPFAQAPPPRRWPWVLASTAALGMLAVQAAIAFRVELATVWPDARPALTALCDFAGCEVGLPAKPGLIRIDASDLHPDGGQAGRLVMTATIKNLAPFSQQFPHLELTLTDTNDKAVARKVLAPADYLSARIPLADGMAPNADVAAGVVIDAGGLAASGYRLYAFYP